jgi:lipid-binding SYLF domain-containing protein
MRLFIALSMLMISSAAHALTDTEKRAENAVTVLKEMMAIPESSIPEKLLAEAYAIAVVPDVGEAGFVFGGRFGKGLISIRGKDGAWSNPNYIKLTGGSFGFQAGIQSSDVILVFTKPEGVNSIIKGKFTLGADAAIAAGPVGRSAQASTDEKFEAEILSYARSKGLFAGVSLDGTAITIDKKANTEMYGDMQSPASIFDGRTQTENKSIIAFRNELEEASSYRPMNAPKTK